MNWEHTDLSMAPKVGTIDELRNQATRHRQVRHLIIEKRSRRVHALRSRFASGLAALAHLIAPSEQPPVQVVPAD